MAKFRMDADQKRYFSTLCAVGNITQAARELYLSRQGLSKSMKGLEEELGTALFVRGKKGVEPTEAGTHPATLSARRRPAVGRLPGRHPRGGGGRAPNWCAWGC